MQLVVRKDTHLRWPRADAATHFITMRLHEDLTEAVKLAVREIGIHRDNSQRSFGDDETAAAKIARTLLGAYHS